MKSDQIRTILENSGINVIPLNDTYHAFNYNGHSFIFFAGPPPKQEIIVIEIDIPYRVSPENEVHLLRAVNESNVQSCIVKTRIRGNGRVTMGVELLNTASRMKPNDLFIYLEMLSSAANRLAIIMEQPQPNQL